MPDFQLTPFSPLPGVSVSGGALRDALIACARRGVKVRLLLDAIGSGACSRAFLKPLVEAGGEVAWFHPTRFWRFWSRPWLNMRTHRKIAVIDSRIGFAGGINITDEENERIPNFYTPVNDFVDRLESARVIRQLPAPRGECEVLPPPAAGWLPGAYVAPGDGSGDR